MDLSITSKQDDSYRSTVEWLATYANRRVGKGFSPNCSKEGTSPLLKWNVCFQNMPKQNKQLPLVAMDKSFAHAVNAVNLSAFSKKCEFLVPSAFYYEIFDTRAANRPRTLAGFDSFRRVDLPSLLQRERKTGKPTEEITAPIHHFNPKVLSPEWTLNAEEMKVQLKYKKNVVDKAIEFWNEMIDKRQVIGFPDDLIKTVHKLSPEAFTALCGTLSNLKFLRAIATGMDFPHAAIIDKSWFYFRHLQALILQGLILARRHPSSKDVRSPERLEHDVHDVEYLTLGLIIGHLATNEVSADFNKFSMKWRFELLRPDGLVITPTTLSSLL